MTWIALADHDDQIFAARGLGQPANATPVVDDRPDALLARGSLMFETRLSPTGKPQTLFEYSRRAPWLTSLSLRAIPGGGVSLVITNDAEIVHAAVHQIAPGRTDVVRIVYAWDAPRRQARFSIERPGSVIPQITEIRNPMPMAVDDLRAMTTDASLRQMSDDLVFFAVSDQIEPIGPLPSLTPSVPILTPHGYRHARDLKRGDLVETPADGLVPVLQTLRRTVPARGSFRPVRLRAPYFGLLQDIIVAPDQRLVISGSEVEYLFGRESVLVPARHLVNGTAALHEPTRLLASYTQVLLPGHNPIIAAGSAAESLYIARLRRKPDLLAASLLAGQDRAMLPEHGRSAFPVLRWFEAITLAEQRAA